MLQTFQHESFCDLTGLLARKTEQQLTISVCIPTLNEEATIGETVKTVRHALMEEVPLIDELAVIDSGSSDATEDIARDAGADFFLAEDILPGLGNHPGKGENLWKAVYQLKGDILCFIDADIRNIHPRFVYGVLGPLLVSPEIQYVKGFYRRPLTGEKMIQPSGGGRVTEILVRPLLSMFYPELTHFAQPLSGEYASRRSVLETLTFPTGYSVEISHLLEIYQRHGMKAFAQTDLEQRVHRNRSTQALGSMSREILACFFHRLEAGNKVSLGEFSSCEALHPGTERPPMKDLAEYRRRFPNTSA